VLQVERLRRARRSVDDRFDPAKSLAGTARYLTIARRTLGRQDLALVSYHMGIGNLRGVLRA
jgi:soluble lytic murein transglycosylase-like protein